MKTESEEQIDFIQWCKRNGIHKIFAIPNGGKRNIVTASKLKLEGVKAGVPDLFLAVSRHNCHGLFIEMKRAKGGSLSPKQILWRDWLIKEKYAWKRADGAKEAIRITRSYLGI